MIAVIKQSLVLVLALMLILVQMDATVFAEESQDRTKGGSALNLLRLV